METQLADLSGPVGLGLEMCGCFFFPLKKKLRAKNKSVWEEEVSGKPGNPVVAAALVGTEGYGPETKTVAYYLGLDPSPAIAELRDLGQVV